MGRAQPAGATGLLRPMLLVSLAIVVAVGLMAVGGRWVHHRWLFHHKIPKVLDHYKLGDGPDDPEAGIVALGGRERAARLLRQWIAENPPRVSGSAQAYFLLSVCDRNIMSELISMLASDNWSERMCAINALWFIGQQGRSAVPALADVLKVHRDDSRMNAEVAATLGRMGPAATPAVSQLCELLDDRDGGVRYRASKALGQIGPTAKDAVPSLITLLGDADADVRRSAIGTLGNIGPNAKDAVPTLRNMLHRDEHTRYLVELALRSIDPSALNGVDPGRKPKGPTATEEKK